MQKLSKSAPCGKRTKITYSLDKPISSEALTSRRNLPYLETRPITAFQPRTSLKSPKTIKNDQKHDIFSLTQLKTQYTPTVKPISPKYPNIEYTERIKIEEKITKQFMDQLSVKYKLQEMNSPYKQDALMMHKNSKLRAQALLESRDRSDFSQRRETMKDFDQAVKEAQIHDKHVVQQTYISSKYGELRIYRI